MNLWIVDCETDNDRYTKRICSSKAKALEYFDEIEQAISNEHSTFKVFSRDDTAGELVLHQYVFGEHKYTRKYEILAGDIGDILNLLLMRLSDDAKGVL